MDFKNKPITWSDEGAEPSDNLKTTGLKPGYKVPASLLNWLFSFIMKVITEIQNAITSHADTLKEKANMQTKDGGFAGGYGAATGAGAAIGINAKTVDRSENPIDAIQLGTGTNTKEKSLQVYDYELMGPNGTIPVERIPELGKLEAKFVDSLPTSFIEGVPISIERCSVNSGDDGYTITSGGNAANKYGLAHIDFSSSAADATSIVIEMDTKVPDTRWLIGFVDLSQRPAESYRTTYDKTGVIFTHGTQDGNYYWVNGNNKWNTTFKSNWFHVRAIINFADKTVQYGITDRATGATVLSGTETFIDSGVTTVTGVEFYSWVNDTAMAVDNIKIIVNHDVSENTLYILNNRNSDMYIYKNSTPLYLSNPEGLAPINSPAFTGTPITPTASAGDSSEQIANTEFVQNAILGKYATSDKAIILGCSKNSMCTISQYKSTSACILDISEGILCFKGKIYNIPKMYSVITAESAGLAGNVCYIGLEYIGGNWEVIYSTSLLSTGIPLANILIEASSTGKYFNFNRLEYTYEKADITKISGSFISALVAICDLIYSSNE